MSKVFREGDVVFHPIRGKLRVTQTESDGCYVRDVENMTLYSNNGMLSFTPWPAPCHERPFTEVGYWLAYFEECEYTVRYRIDADRYKIMDKSNTVHRNTRGLKWIKFLGKEIE